MNASFFELKRAHQSSLRISREIAAQHGTTPARFDMLYAVSKGARLQSDLRRVLGVTAATVSRMIAALERLGLVARHRPEGDTRQRKVTLLAPAKSLLRDVFEGAIDSGLVQVAFDSAFMDGPLPEDADYHYMSVVEHVCRKLRHAFRDTATLYYSWHFDD